MGSGGEKKEKRVKAIKRSIEGSISEEKRRRRKTESQRVGEWVEVFIQISRRLCNPESSASRKGSNLQGSMFN